MADVKGKIIGIISEQLDMNKEDIIENARFKEELGADSLDMSELVMAFEDEFDIEITDDELSESLTVGDAIQIVSRKIS